MLKEKLTRQLIHVKSLLRCKKALKMLENIMIFFQNKNKISTSSSLLLLLWYSLLSNLIQCDCVVKMNVDCTKESTILVYEQTVYVYYILQNMHTRIETHTHTDTYTCRGNVSCALTEKWAHPMFYQCAHIRVCARERVRPRLYACSCACVFVCVCVEVRVCL